MQMALEAGAKAELGAKAEVVLAAVAHKRCNKESRLLRSMQYQCITAYATVLQPV